MDIKIEDLKIEPKTKGGLKSKQLHLLLTEENYSKLKKLATASNRTMNDFINSLIAQL